MTALFLNRGAKLYFFQSFVKINLKILATTYGYLYAQLVNMIYFRDQIFLYHAKDIMSHRFFRLSIGHDS